MKNILKKPKDLFSIICFCLKMSVNPSSKQFRKYFYLNIFFALIMVSMPFLLIYVTSQIMQLLSLSLLAAEVDYQSINVFIFLCAMSLTIGFVSKIIENFKIYCDGMHREIINNHIRVLIMEKSSNLDVRFFDSPSFYNGMRDANNSITRGSAM